MSVGDKIASKCKISQEGEPFKYADEVVETMPPMHARFERYKESEKHQGEGIYMFEISKVVIILNKIQTHNNTLLLAA